MILQQEQYDAIEKYMRGNGKAEVGDHLAGLTRGQLESIAGYLRARTVRAELAQTRREADAGKGAAGVTEEQFARIYAEGVTGLLAVLDKLVGLPGPYGDGARFAMQQEVAK